MSVSNKVTLPKRLDQISKQFEETLNIERNYSNIQSQQATYTTSQGGYILINLPPGINNTKCCYLTFNCDVENGSNSYNRLSNPYPNSLFTRLQVYAGSVLLEDVQYSNLLYTSLFSCKPYNAVNNNGVWENTDATRATISSGNNMFRMDLDLLQSLQCIWPTSMMNNQISIRLYLDTGANCLEGDISPPVATLSNIFIWFSSLVIKDPDYEEALKQSLARGIQLPVLSWEGNIVSTGVSSTNYTQIIPFKRRVCQAMLFLVREEGLSFDDDDKMITTITNVSEFSVKINGLIYPIPKYLDTSSTPAFGWVYRNIFQDFMKSVYFDHSPGDENVLQFIQSTYRPLLIDLRKSYGKFPGAGLGNGIDISGNGSSVVLQLRFNTAPTSAEIIAYNLYENIITLSNTRVLTNS